MNYYDIVNIISYMDIDMMLLMRRMSSILNQEIGRIRMMEDEDLIYINEEFEEFIGLRIGSYRISREGTRINAYDGKLLNIQFIDACSGGHLIIVQNLLEKTEQLMNDMNHENMVNNLMLEDDDSFNIEQFLNHGISNACLECQFCDNSHELNAQSCGHMHVVKFLIDKINSINKIVDWKRCLEAACEGENMNIIQLMIEEITNTQVDNPDVVAYWNWGLRGACNIGNLEIVKLMISKGADNWNDGLCWCSNLEIAKFMIEKGADNFNDGLQYACLDGSIEIIKLMIEKGANDWIGGLESACQGRHLDIVKLMIEKGANDWHDGLIFACNSGNLEIVQLMIEMGADNWDHGLAVACGGKNWDIIQLMIEKGGNDWNGGLSYACEFNHPNTIRLMIEKGATQCGECGKSIEEHLHMIKDK